MWGLNDPVKSRVVGDFLRSAFVKFRCLMKTHVRNANCASVLDRFGVKWKCVSSFNRGRWI